MNRLRKFVEQGSYGEKSGRIAYAFGAGNLPDPSHGFAWHPIAAFNAGDELIENAGLKDVFKAALASGCAVVRPEK